MEKRIKPSVIYLDWAATTNPTEHVVQRMTHVMSDIAVSGNPSSVHCVGLAANEMVRNARREVVRQLGGLEKLSHDNIVFTSGGTEGNNMVISGWIAIHRCTDNHVILYTPTSHHSVLEAIRFSCIEDDDYSESIPLNVVKGTVDLEGFELLLQKYRHCSILVCVEHVNNETGVIQPISEMADIIAEYSNIELFVDGVQGFPHLIVDVDDLGVDFYTFSAHKFHGPKGIGAVYMRDKRYQNPLIVGGQQEWGMRGGTQNVPGIVGLEAALKDASSTWDIDQMKVKRLYDLLLECLNDIPEVVLTLPLADSICPAIVNLTTPLESSFLVQALSAKGICVSSGAACSGAKEESHVLKALYLDGKHGLRVSLDARNTEEEIRYFVSVLKQILGEYKELLLEKTPDDYEVTL